MAMGLKVRLDDGSEVGPLELVMIQTWYQQGLLNAGSMVQRPGNPRWMRLSDAVDLRQWVAPVQAGTRGRGAAARGGAGSVAVDAAGAPDTERWRLLVAAVLFFVLAAGAGLAAFRPERVRPELDGAPWWQIALGLAVLGLLLVRGWDVGRRVVRALTILAAAAAFPLAGIFVARGLRGEAFLLLGSAALLAAGLAAFLVPVAARLTAVASLLVALVGGAGLVRFGPAEISVLPQIEEWATPDRRLVDAESGLTLDLPPGWVLLKPGQTLVASPPSTRALLAHPRVAAHALLLFEPPPAQALTLEHYLDDVVARRRADTTGFEEDWRRDGRLGAVVARRARLRRATSEGRFVERVVVAQDGDRYAALIAWAPEASGGRATEEIDALEAAVALSGVRAAGRREAVGRANLELPHVSIAGLRLLVESGGPAEPAELFRRAAAATARGQAAMEPAAAQELKLLTQIVLGGIQRRDRAQLAAYLERVAAGQPTAPEEDERMRLLMKGATLRLETGDRERLEQLHEEALRAGASR